MATLRNQFNQALINIEVNGAKADRAKAAHEEIRKVLEPDEQLKAWGVDTKLIGSYGRDTGIYPGKDVDVFVKFTWLDTTATPKDVYDAVWACLKSAYGDVAEGGRAEAQARSVKVSFPDPDNPNDENAGFAVDAVPAVRDGEHWAIPTKDRGRWSESAGRWVTTDPEEFGELSRALSTSSSSPVVGNRNAYKPVVKLMRQARRAHLGERRPGGLYIEFATYEAWKHGLISGEEWDPLLAATLRRVANRLASASHLPFVDPALGTSVEPRPSDEDLAHAASVFSGLADLGGEAVAADDCLAAVKWRSILGGNDRADPVFPLPPGCDANGFPISAIAAVAGRGSNEARGFG
jgi:SMODS domain-containing protein